MIFLALFGMLVKQEMPHLSKNDAVETEICLGFLALGFPQIGCAI